MEPERWAQIEELFHRAAECDAEERTALLDEACNGDAELRQAVEALLDGEENATDDLQAAVHGGLDAVTFPLVGETVSHYRILDGLGEGGMGLVYRAEDIRLGRQVALKFLPEESAKDPAALGRFEREARSASALAHPNICPIYEFGEHEGQPFLVMQLLEGRTVRELLSTSGAAQLPLPKLLDLAMQIVEGLDAAHRRGIIHRDIKPANIFVTDAGEVKILDFGLAKPSRADTPEDLAERVAGAKAPTVSDAFLSRTGAAMGTAAYMSPEQIRGEKLDARTDLFSFGLVLYEMATGKQAFPGENPPEIHAAIQNNQPRPVREQNAQIPAALETVIHRAIEKDRERRYQSAAEMRSDLQTATETLSKAPSGESSAFARGRLLLVCAAVVAIGAFWIVRHYFGVHPTTLAASDFVLVSDFVNTTGEPIFDGPLKQAVSVKLAESPYFSLVPESRIRPTMKSMERSTDERLLPPVSREVCQRVGAKVLVGGSIVRAGDQYELELTAADCNRGTKVADEKIDAQDKDQVLSNLGKVLPNLRRSLGESISSIQRFDTPIEQATTRSLAALKAYTSGEQKRAQGKESESIPDYKLATELDPGFAMAYARLANVSGNLSQLDLADEYLRKAFELRGHISEKEKFYIQARYYSDTAREPENEIETYKVWAQVYPRDVSPFNSMASAYIEIGQPEKAVEAGQQALRLNPSVALSYVNLARAYERTARFAEAKAICEKAIAQKLDSFWIHTILFRIAFVTNDAPAIERESDWFAGKPQENQFVYYQAKAALSLGEVRKSRQQFERARQLSEAKGVKETAIAISNSMAQFAADIGNLAEAREVAQRVLRNTPEFGRHKVFAILALARSGDASGAATLLTEMAKHPMPGTGINNVVLPCIRAAVALDRQKPAAALTALEAAAPYDLGTDSGGMTLYYRGLAYLQMKSANEAITQFQRIIDNRGVVDVDVYWPLAHLGLARAYALAGDTENSLAHYREVLTFWKDADPDFAIHKKASAEYARLSNTPVRRAPESASGSTGNESVASLPKAFWRPKSVPLNRVYSAVLRRSVLSSSGRAYFAESCSSPSGTQHIK